MSTYKISLIGIENLLSHVNKSVFDNIALPPEIDKETLVNNILFRAGDFELLYSDPDYLSLSTQLFFKKNYPIFKRWNDAMSLQYNVLENYDRYEDTTVTGANTKNTSSSGTDSNNTSGSDGNITSDTSTGTHGVINHNETDTNNGVIDHTETDNTNDVENGVMAYNVSADYSDHDASNAVGHAETDYTSNSSSHNESDGTSNSTDNITSTGNSNRTYSENNTASHSATITEGDNSNVNTIGHIHGNIGVTTAMDMVEQELRLARFNVIEEITEMYIKDFCLPVYD